MQGLRTIIVQDIRESVPRGQNINKVFSEQQKKDETPTEWLERLQKNWQSYGGLDPETPAGEEWLRTQFIAKSWVDIRRKLEKLKDWQNKGLDKLLREAQKAYVRREEEKERKQSRMMVVVVYEGLKGPEQRWRTEVTCFYCNKKGHMKRECRQRKTDEKRLKSE